MMFGWRHPCRYAECTACGTLQLVDVPERLADYYPSDYYSLAAPTKPARKGNVARAWFCRWLTTSRSALAGAVTRRLAAKYPFVHWARLCDASLGDAFLDVGCGSGGLLYRMRRWGFSNLAGVDPFTNNPLDVPGLKIEKCELADMSGRFDAIMLHHVLEHVPDPIAMLVQARERLNHGGRVLVRIPVAGSYVARTYGADWFNLDAPRHLVIPSRRGLEAIAQGAGLVVAHTEFDSTKISFLMSEQYRRDMPMHGPKLSFMKTDEERYAASAKALNASGDGDLGVFVLKVA